MPRNGRTGYTTTVITPWGPETYQVWLEESPPVWIARIMTLPNRVWALPGGREAIKFFGSTPEEADSAAARFIEDERLVTRRRVASHAATSRQARARAVRESPVARPVRADAWRAPRFYERLLLRFGTERPERPGLTANISETGLFVITDRPGEVGSSVAIDLRFPDMALNLGGEVVWVRELRDLGSLGFGARLIEPSNMYLTRIRSLATPGSKR